MRRICAHLLRFGLRIRDWCRGNNFGGGLFAESELSVSAHNDAIPTLGSTLV